MVQGGLDAGGLPEHDDVDHDAEAVELVFLTGLVVLTELAALPVEDVAGQRIAAVAPAEQAVDGVSGRHSTAVHPERAFFSGSAAVAAGRY